ncbi:MAG: patatin-like phospholipase family protein [Chloroflexota bacterium]
MTIRTLVLSGGGGRGAFHAGVYKYLMQEQKRGVDAEHQAPWKPDIVIGTSIGAVNGAAIAQGVTAHALEQFWLSLREKDIQGIPPGMRALSRWVWNRALKSAIGTRLPQVSQEEAFSPSAKESWPPLPVMPRRLSESLIGRWNNLLDTAPLYRTLQERLGLDEERINSSETALLISATNVRTGEGMIFTNNREGRMRDGTRREDMQAPITLRRIIASCSIPLVYPWTQDDLDPAGSIYWDGAVISNTPLGAAFDVVRDRDVTEDMEIVIVMMTPWWESHGAAPNQGRLPSDFGEAITWALDWALLASFRVDLKLMSSFNELALARREMQQDQKYRMVKAVIVAPEQFLPVARIIDYDRAASSQLIDMGYTATQRAFEAEFSG